MDPYNPIPNRLRLQQLGYPMAGVFGQQQTMPQAAPQLDPFGGSQEPFLGATPMAFHRAQSYALPGGQEQSRYGLPGDWQTTGVFPNGGFDANAINASNPVARQNALHILNDYGGENRESQNQQDAQSNTDQANQNQQDTGVYGYGSLG
jgi:hypothetical protein